MQKKVNLKEVQWTNTLKILNQIGEESTMYYRSLLDKKDPYASNATYSLYDSIDHRVDINEIGFILWFISAEHWKNVETGRRAGLKQPPGDIIKKWMLDKGLPYKKGAEYVIARSIGENGIPAKNYFKQTQDKALKLTPAIVNAITKDYSEFLKSKTKDITIIKK